MLLHLSVENFILIPQLEISLHKGFTCITGETGAGKSILVGALAVSYTHLDVYKRQFWMLFRTD